MIKNITKLKNKKISILFSGMVSVWAVFPRHIAVGAVGFEFEFGAQNANIGHLCSPNFSATFCPFWHGVSTVVPA